MAASHSSTASSFLLLRSTKTLLPTVSCISISKPRKPTTRKNHLRPKLLKPISTPRLQISEVTLFLPLEKESNLPKIDQFPEESNEVKIQDFDQFPGESSTSFIDGEVKEVKIQVSDQLGALESSESVEIDGLKVGMFSKNSFLKFGLWLVGAFVFQSVCAIWVFKFGDSKVNHQNMENENERVRDSRMNNIVNGNVMVGNKGNLGTIDELMEKKIEEIRIMAREARNRERLEQEMNGLDGNESDYEDEEEEDFGKSGIEKEVNERLNKLKEKLEKNRDKIPRRLENLKGENVMNGKEKNGLDVNPENQALIFKKRYKYKGSFSNQMDRPKGFSVPSEKDHSKVEETRSNFENEVSGSDLADASKILDDNQRLKLDIPDGNMRNVVKDPERRRQGRNIDDAEHKFLKVQDRNNGGSVGVTSDSRDPSILKANDVTNHQNRTTSSYSLERRQQLKQSGISKKPHSGSEWWEKLPYVLVILMQQGQDDDEARGLYTLKSSSGAEGELSHIVAFQDRGDATNFCYLLQLYFEDLGDFSIDVVPLSMKELKEAMKSNTKRVIVVKKGQLQLFVGQPISDVEMGLRSLMEQD